jgi:hypothetical protein
MKYFLTFCAALLLYASAIAQAASNRVDKFAEAIAYAEGYGRPGVIPTRYHNPGDIKGVKGWRFPGQRALGKGNHVIFRTDADGWNALREQIRKIVDGRSKHYTADMTIAQMARRYAARSHNWTVMVTKKLGVPASTRLRDYLVPDMTADVCDLMLY